MAELVILLAEILGPPMARLIAAGIESLAQSLEAMNAPPTTAGVVIEIVRGLDRSHPDWPGELKREYAVNAVSQHLTNNGITPDAAAVNSLIEAAVMSLRAPIVAASQP